MGASRKALGEALEASVAGATVEPKAKAKTKRANASQSAGARAGQDENKKLLKDIKAFLAYTFETKTKNDFC